MTITDQSLGVDIDETISNTVLYWMGAIQRQFGGYNHLSPEQLVAQFKYTSRVPEWQTEAVRSWHAQQKHDVELHRAGFAPIQGAAEGLTKIASRGDIAYITIRSASLVEATRDWLRTNGFPPGAHLIACPDETPEHARAAWKAETIAKLYPALWGMVDDSDEVVNALPGGYAGKVFHFNAPSRTRVDIAVYPCADWRCVVEAVERERPLKVDQPREQPRSQDLRA